MNDQPLREALKDARASFLGLQPDFGGPVAAQMGQAIERINKALATPSNTCQNCIHWQRRFKPRYLFDIEPTPLNVGECGCEGGQDPIRTSNGFEVEANATDDSGLRWALVTGPDFGCVHFRAKT